MLNGSPNWPLLSVTRFVLALLVVTFHLFVFNQGSRILSISMMLNAFAAVMAFLVISGYSIAHSYSKRPEGFFPRRIRRVYPVYLICLFFSLTPFYFTPVHIVLPSGYDATWPTLWQFIGNMLLLQPTFVAPMKQIMPNWTLGVECAFYAMAPLFARLSRKALVVIICLSIVIFALQPFSARLSTTLISSKVGIFAILVLAWAWLMGWYMAKYPRSNWSVAFLILSPGVLMLNRQTGVPAEGTALVLAATNTVIALGHRIEISKKLQGFLNYLGELSYPMYLIHLPLFFLIQVATKQIFNPLFYVGATLIASAMVYHLFDAPFRRLGNRKYQNHVS